LRGRREGGRRSEQVILWGWGGKLLESRAVMGIAGGELARENDAFTDKPVTLMWTTRGERGEWRGGGLITAKRNPSISVNDFFIKENGGKGTRIKGDRPTDVPRSVMRGQWYPSFSSRETPTVKDSLSTPPPHTFPLFPPVVPSCFWTQPDLISKA